jgi:hypothetical protein
LLGRSPSQMVFQGKWSWAYLWILLLLCLLFFLYRQLSKFVVQLKNLLCQVLQRCRNCTRCSPFEVVHFSCDHSSCTTWMSLQGSSLSESHVAVSTLQTQ